MKVIQIPFGKLRDFVFIQDKAGKGYDAHIDLHAAVRNQGKENDMDLGVKAFAYLFRRLGPPKGGFPKAYLGEWVINTSNEDIVLKISCGTDITIKVIGRESLATSYMDWFFAPIKAWFDDCGAWAIETHKKAIYGSTFPQLPKEQQEIMIPFFNADLTAWENEFLSEERKAELIVNREKNPTVPQLFDEEYIAFFQWKAKECDTLREEYIRINPFPVPSGEFATIYQWHKEIHTNSDNESAKQVYTAIQETLTELFKPLVIEGCYFNLLGLFEENESTEEKEAEAKSLDWVHTGNGFIEYDLKDYNRWMQSCQLAAEIGKGDVQAGFDKVLAGHKNARLHKGRKATKK